MVMAKKPRSVVAMAASMIATVAAFAPHRAPTVLNAFATKSGVPPSSSSARYLSDNQLPFFAGPAFSSSSPAGSGPGTSSQPPQSATVTLRLPIGTLFDGRDYVFVTESNVRGYEWTTKEADVLLDDLTDAALGNLGGKPGDRDDAAVDGSASATDQFPGTIASDYELSQIVLVPTSDWDSNVLGLGNRYDVYDGQQRLVTLNLLLASLRDAFQREAGELNSGSHGGGKRGVALAATAAEIAGMLRPTKVRKEDVMRITLRRRDNVLLERILVGESARGGGDDEGDDEHPDMPPVKTFAKLSPKGKSKLLSSLSPANERIFQNFVHLSNRLDLLTTRERLQLLDYVVERVYLLVCIPETSRIARNIVMSQGRKGMDNEPVDDFKGLVCFRYTLEEEDMYQTFDQWDTLAAQPSASSSEDQEGSGIKSVGRDVISAACILRASASLRAKIRSRGGDEVYEWERWLRNELWLQNQKQPSKELFQGKDFFANSIEPASIALYKFRTRQWDEFNFLSKTRKMTKKQRDTIVARLNFLLDITSGVASAKEAEIATLELLLRAGDEEESNAMVSRYLNEILPLVEKWTLWMAVARPSPMQRHSRVFALLDAMDDVDSLGSTDDSEMANSLIESIDKYQFGASASGKRLAAAIMKRINSHLLIEGKKNTPASDGSATVELIQQTQWNNDEEEEEWANRIGNLALVSTSPRRKANAKSDAHSWQSKCDRYSKEKWLTTRLLGVFEQWNTDTLQDQQKELLSLIEMVWDLGSRS